jgi:hypothetical protein
MVTLFASTAPHRIERQEVMGHIAILEQATHAVHEGYVGPPLYHQAAHTAQRLLALVEAMGWDEGTRIAHEIRCLFQTATLLGLVQALHLSELIAAFYRAMAHPAAGQHPPAKVLLWEMAALQSPQWPAVTSWPVPQQ